MEILSSSPGLVAALRWMIHDLRRYNGQCRRRRSLLPLRRVPGCSRRQVRRCIPGGERAHPAYRRWRQAYRQRVRPHQRRWSVGVGSSCSRNTVNFVAGDNWNRRIVDAHVAVKGGDTVLGVANVAPICVASIWVSFSGRRVLGAISVASGGSCSFSSGSSGASGRMTALGSEVGLRGCRGRGVGRRRGGLRAGLSRRECGRAAGRLRICCACPVPGHNTTARQKRRE